MPVRALDNLVPIFPIQDFIDKTYHPLSAILFKKPGWITGEIIKEINSLISFRGDQRLRTYLFAIKSAQLLHLLFLQKHYTGSTPIPEEILDAVRETRHIIESSIIDIPDVEAISKQVHLSIYELKKYFKLVVGIGISAFINKAKLTNAKLLVEETDLPIKEIARIAGYEYEQNFIQAFRKCFDYTPYFIRQLR
jgi:AraC-like DNA-binding protein